MEKKVRCVYRWKYGTFYGPIIPCIEIDGEHNSIVLLDQDGSKIRDNIWIIDSFNSGFYSDNPPVDSTVYYPIVAGYIIVQDVDDELFKGMFCWGTDYHEHLRRFMKAYHFYLHLRSPKWCWLDFDDNPENFTGILNDIDIYVYAITHLYTEDFVKTAFFKTVSDLLQDKTINFNNDDIWFIMPPLDGYRFPNDSSKIQLKMQKLYSKLYAEKDLDIDCLIEDYNNTDDYDWKKYNSLKWVITFASRQLPQFYGNDLFVKENMNKEISKTVIKQQYPRVNTRIHNTEINETSTRKTVAKKPVIWQIAGLCDAVNNRLEKRVADSKPCIGFSMNDAEKAYEHMDMELVKNYGDIYGKNILHTWDDGWRALMHCKKCGGYILLQVSEFHGMDDDSYYVDFFPVTGPTEAQEINEKYNGENIEDEFPHKWLIFDRNPHWNR